MTEEMSYPQHARLAEVKDDCQVIRDFLDWVLHERDVRFVLCQHAPGNTVSPTYVPTVVPVEDLIAEYFGIDPVAYGREISEIASLHGALTKRR
jgi:hypothetical protein